MADRECLTASQLLSLENEESQNIWQRLQAYEQPDSDEEPTDYEECEGLDVNPDDSDAEEPQMPAYNPEDDSDDELDEDPVELETCVNYISSDQKTWSATQPPTSRVTSQNIFKSADSGPICVTDCLTIVDTFKLIMTNEMCDIIIRETNRKANRLYEGINKRNPTKEQRVWQELTAKEFDAYLGLLLLGGVTHSNYVNIKDLWKTTSHPLFRAALSVNRFWAISRLIRFDNGITRQQRKQYDKAAAISDIFSMLNESLQKYYVAGANVTVDKQLYPFRGGTGFTQYISSKPAKYGIKVWWVCDSITSYPLKGKIYTGMAPSGEHERNVGEMVVKDLCVNLFKGSGRNIVCDNFFTTYNLAKTLMTDNNLSLLGTVNKRHSFVPLKFANARGRPLESTIFGFSDNITMCSYVQKKNRAVVLLSTKHYDTKITGGPKHKPVHILDYNKFKGGVEKMEKCLSEYSTKRRTNRWSLSFFYNILDIAAYAAYIIYMENNPYLKVSTSRRREFLHKLSDQLAMPQMEVRCSNPQVTKIFSTRNAFEAITGATIPIEVDPLAAEERDKTGRIKVKGSCYLCSRRRRTRKACSICHKPICAEHSKDIPHCLRCI